MTKNIYTLEQLKENIPWEGKKVALVGGCFDLLHYGHVLFLENARKQADVLVVMLESDEFISSKKDRQAVHTQSQRAHILSCLHFVDYVITLPLLNNDKDYMEVVKTVKPSIIAVTDKDPFIRVKEEHARSVGAEVKIVAPLIEPFSSSKIIQYETIFSG